MPRRRWGCLLFLERFWGFFEVLSFFIYFFIIILVERKEKKERERERERNITRESLFIFLFVCYIFICFFIFSPRSSLQFKGERESVAILFLVSKGKERGNKKEVREKTKEK